MENINYQSDVMKDLQGYFKPGERKLIYNSAKSLRDKLLIRVLWKSGRRIGEILQLKVEDINFDNNGIVWNIEKKTKSIGTGEFDYNGKEIKKKVKDYVKRWKPQDKFTLKLLNYYIKSNNLYNNDYVFFSPFKKTLPITRQRADQIIKRICEKIGILKVGNSKPHCHHFRHSFAIYGAEKCKSPADIRKLQIILEHSSLNITTFYLQFSEESTRDIMEMDEDEIK